MEMDSVTDMFRVARHGDGQGYRRVQNGRPSKLSTVEVDFSGNIRSHDINDFCTEDCATFECRTGSGARGNEPNKRAVPPQHFHTTTAVI
jgi:hypothetical protein